MRIRRLAPFYFTCFAQLGVMLPYLNLYYERLSLSGTEIGALAAILSLGRIAAALLWGYRADRSGGRRALTIAACALNAGALALLLPARTFAGFALASLAVAMVDGPRLPLVEATTLELAHAGALVYGRVRAWGSIGFIVSALATGAALTVVPIRFVLYAMLGWAALNCAASFILPAVPHDARRHGTSLRAFLARPQVLIFLTGCMLMQASHGAYYAFFTIHLDGGGYNGASIGALWALAVLAEVILMFFSSRFIDRISPRRLMIACALLAAARFGLYGASLHPAVLVIAQLTHAFTFGAFHIVAIGHVHRLLPPDLRASGQSLFSGVTYGLGSLAGMLSSGFLFDTIGPARMFGCAALAALGAAALLTRLGRLGDNDAHGGSSDARGGHPAEV